MKIKVLIPTPLQKLTGAAEVSGEGDTVLELVGNLDRKYPGFKDRVSEKDGKIRKFINIYVNEEDIRFLKMENTPLKDGDEVSIIPAIAGGIR